MLVDMRQKASSWIGWFIIGFLVLGFSFYGITSYLTGGANPVVASLGDIELKRSEYTRMLEREQQSQRQRFGDAANEFVSTDEFKESVARNYVTSQFINQYVMRDLAMIGSDKEVAEFIRNDPNFHLDGKFDADIYRDNLKLRGTSASAYEDSIRGNVVMNQLQSGIAVDNFVSDIALEQGWSVLGENRSGRYVVLENTRYRANINLSDDELRAYYDEHIDEYQVPAGFRIGYVRVGKEEVRQQVSVTEQDIADYYEDNKSQFQTPSVKSASHILIAVNSGRDAESAVARAEEVIKKLNDGESFASLAKEYSDDPGSAESGGSLGPVEAGMMVPEFEQALFAMDEVGSITEPIRTDFGYHVIKLDDVEESVTSSLAEVKDLIRTQLEDGKIEEKFAQLQTDMANVAYEDSSTLEGVAELAAAEIVESSWSSGSDTDEIFDNAPIRSALENSEVTVDGYNSEVIELESGALVVLRVIEAREAAPIPFADVISSVRSVASRQAALKEAEIEGNELIEKINSVGFDSAVSQKQLTFNSVSGTKTAQQSDLASAEALSLLFSIKEPGTSQGGGDADGNYIVAELAAVEKGQVPNADNAQFTQYENMKDSLSVHYSIGMLQKYVDFIVAENGGVDIDLSSLK